MFVSSTNLDFVNSGIVAVMLMNIQFAPTKTVQSINVPTDIPKLAVATKNMTGANLDNIVNLVI